MRIPRHSARLVLGAAAALLACTMHGCNIVAPIVIATAPEPTVPAQYTLQNRRTVVFIDDRNNHISPTALRRVLADRTTEKLMEKGIISPDNAIRPRDALALAASNDRNGSLMSIGEIGEAVGAEVLIYVRIEAFSSSVDGYKPQPAGGSLVKVMDITNQTRLFPDVESEESWARVSTVGKEVSQKLYESRVSQRQIFEMLALEMGDDVAELFYDHAPDDVLGSNLNGPPR